MVLTLTTTAAEQLPEVQTAGLTIGLLIVAAVSILFLSRLLLQTGTTEQSFQEDDTPTSLSSRGVYINTVIGRRRVGAAFGWAGFRFTVEEVVGSVGGGGKGGGPGPSGGNITQTVYFEDGWHVLCMGPASTLHAIHENGKNILPNPISKSSTPNGSTITTDVGKFSIYWGDPDQPVNFELAARIGVASRWPYVCYVLWKEKRNGTGPTWAQLEYDISAMDCVENPDIVGSFEPVLADPVTDAFGMNPAAILYQLITADFPHGAGYDADLLDFDSLEALGLLMETEGLAMNLHLREGNNDIDRWIQSILLDAGTLIVDHPEGRLQLPSLREPSGTLPVVDGQFQTQPEVEVEVVPFDSVGQINRVIFQFKDKLLNYRDNTVEFGDDGVAEEVGAYRTTKLRIPTVTSKQVARRIANRRASEAIGDLSNIKYTVVRGATMLLPGQVFEDEEGRVVRVLSKQLKTASSIAVLDTMLDTYGLPLLSDTDDDDLDNNQNTASKDNFFTFFEVPASVGGTGSIAVAVVRSRKNRRQAGAFVHASIDDEVSFFTLGNQNPAAAGFTLVDAIAVDAGPDLIEEGPVMQGVDFDAVEVVNLADQTAEWQNGRQLMIVEDTSGSIEVFFVREIAIQSETVWQASTLYNVGDYVIPSALQATGLRYKCTNATGTQLSDTAEPVWPTLTGVSVADNEVSWMAEQFQYQAKGLIRARYGTPLRAFAADDKVWIIETTRLTLLRSLSLLTPGETLCVRTQPFTSSEQVNIDNVTSVCKVLTGDAVSAEGESFLITGDGESIVTNIGDRIIIKDD